MSHAIYKYQIPGASTFAFAVAMPVNARILTVQAQHQAICIWAMVNTSAPMEWRYFNVFSTGWEIGDWSEGSYLATVQFLDGSYVLHVFEGSAPKPAT